MRTVVSEKFDTKQHGPTHMSNENLCRALKSSSVSERLILACVRET